MKFLDIRLEDEPVNALMEDILKNTVFSSIRIFCVDYTNHKLAEKYAADKKASEGKKGRAIPSAVFELLQKMNKTLCLDKDSVVFDGTTYSKSDSANSCEIYIPLLKELDKEYCFGLILLGSDAMPEESMGALEDKAFRELLKKLFDRLSMKDGIARRKESMYQITYMLCEIIDVKEPYLISRLFNIAYWGIKIARYMGVSQEDIERLQMAILMHDLGKIYIDESILNKKGKLSGEEYETIKKKVIYSYEIAQKLNQLYVISDLPDIILNYQERVDGKGYPNGKTGDKIPFLSKILGTAKAISSMLANTSHRGAKTIPEAISELKNNANKQFDPEIVNAAAALLRDEGKEGEDCFSNMGTYAILNIKRMSGNVGAGARDGAQAGRTDGGKEPAKGDTGESRFRKSRNVWGNIRKIGDEYVFTPSTKESGIDADDIESCRLYTTLDERIYWHKPEIKEVSDDRIVFSKLERADDTNAFTIRWLLEGCFVTESRDVYNIFVTMVGDAFIDFYILADELDEDATQGVVRITFEDGRTSTLPGMIIFSQKIAEKTHVRLKMTGSNEAERKVIFSEIFKKQIAIKSLIREGGH